MKLFGFAIVLILAVHAVQGQIPSLGPCPQVKVPDDFRLDDYMGVWYEYERYPFIFEVGSQCTYANYTKISDDSISVVNAGINRFTGRPSQVTGTATVVAPGKLAVSFPFSKIFEEDSPEVNYEVLGTDYTSYAVVYSCKELIGIANSKVLWVLTREREPPQDVVQKAEAVIDENNLLKAFLMRTHQSGCGAPTTNDEGAGAGEGEGGGAGEDEAATESDATMSSVNSIVQAQSVFN